ncbi:MAG: CcmD family protein [Chloroflexi bacterium]|nr:CcmD family protein [Chloroflexota bacterium]MCY3938452.1 CcmD family protein [Chloroflexota bacterium]
MSDNSTFLLFLFLGFAVAWLGIIAYVMYVGARLRAVERDLESLRTPAADAPERSSGSGVDQD